MKRKWIALILAGSFLFLPGCEAVGKSATTSSAGLPEIEQEPPTWQQKTEPVTMTFYSEMTIPQDYPDVGSRPLWGDDPVSQHIQKLTGVKLVDPSINLSHYVSAHERSDLFHCVATGSGLSIDDPTYCYSLDELASQYCPDFWNDTDPLEILNNMADDGHIYTIRSDYYNDDVYRDERVPIYPAYATVINTKWLAAIGQSMPTSIEELEKCLYQVKNLNQGIIPFNMGNAIFSPIASWMGIMEDNYWEQENRTVRTPFRQERWLDYLKLMNRWYQEDLLHLPSMEQKPNYNYYDTETNLYAFNMHWVDMGNYLQNCSSTAFATSFEAKHLERAIQLNKGASVTDDFQWQVITEPLTWQGETHLIAQDNGAFRRQNYGINLNYSSGLYIPKSCSNPERAILFYQFLMSDDGAKLTHWGIEGTHYTLDDHNLPVYLNEYRADADLTQEISLDLGNEEHGLHYWRLVPNNYYSNLLKAKPDSYMTNQDVIQLRTQLARAGRAYKNAASENKCPVLQFAEPAPGREEHPTYIAIYRRWLNAMEEIITQSADAAEVEDRWAALMTELRTMGLDNLEKSMTLRFAQALERYHKAGYYTNIQP